MGCEVKDPNREIKPKNVFIRSRQSQSPHWKKAQNSKSMRTYTDNITKSWTICSVHLGETAQGIRHSCRQLRQSKTHTKHTA